MLPEDAFAQFQERARAAHLDVKPLDEMKIIAHYRESTESFMYEDIPTNRQTESHGEHYTVKLKSNALGYVFTALLNIDFEVVAEILLDREWEESADIRSAPPINYEEIYNRLLSVSDVFGLYLPNEWDMIRYDLETTHEGVAHTVEILKKYIAFCDRKQIPYNGQFFTFLLYNGYFEVEPSVVMPVEPIEIMDISFDDVGEFVDELDEIYDIFINGFDQDATDLTCYVLGPEDRLRDIAMISFNELASRGKTIRQCHNCGKYFIPAKRADTLYCDNPSPEAPEMTCKEYGNRRLWYEKQKEDELATLSRNIASAKCMLAKRNPDIPQYAESYTYFKEQRLIWIKAIKEGTKTKEEYKEWLLCMQSQKIIKEATHGND